MAAGLGREAVAPGTPGEAAEVTKMVKAFGCPASDEDAAKIIAYLAANYGKK